MTAIRVSGATSNGAAPDRPDLQSLHTRGIVQHTVRLWRYEYSTGNLMLIILYHCIAEPTICMEVPRIRIFYWAMAQ